jgi:hypothetical protein
MTTNVCPVLRPVSVYQRRLLKYIIPPSAFPMQVVERSQMTNITIVSTFTTIGGRGKLDFGECNIEETTVQDLKFRIEMQSNVNVREQTLWWKGYVMDDDNKSLLQACVGVNAGEMIDPSLKSLRIFLTVPLDKYTAEEQSDDRIRSSSFDLLSEKYERSSQANSQSNCALL